ncbi:prolyl 4-hydroxylase subunit alpha-1 [Rhipicephalus sanguineus]|uniref:prolyl 4-hydroxylase subunit alpha-1 n=1 Tax=Rhipicephalus sanguineus TaxID=34632 RepID=UPI0018963B15|nr:prolyl 4-hydroxylase subunit alpha-1 [Rhipicephalus sanguineus]
MQESMATEVLNLEDAHYFLSLEETRLDRAAAQHRTPLTNRPRIGFNTVLGKFIYACRLDDLQSDLASSSASGDAFFNSLLSAFAAPSSREWWPADSDVRGVADGFCKLQRVYEVSVVRIVAMISRRLPSVSPQDLSLIARGCYANATHANTTAWSEQALAAGLPTDARRAALQSKHHNLYPAPPETDVDEYKSVCAEKGDLRTTTAELSCVMWTGDGDPRLILAPLKLEVLSLTPRVVVFADFLTPSEVAYIQDTGHTGLKRGAIYDSGNPSGVTSYKRISKVSWLWDTEHPFLSSLGRRISLASGLSLESSEAYQVANYGLGGHYTAHNDARDFEQVADEWYTRDGNRVATMLLYLTDVSLGGATAFVRLQLAVKPRRGSALFWYDRGTVLG